MNKSFLQYMSEDVEDYGTIYLDMDGVLADFIGGLENAFGTEGAEDFLGTSGSSTKWDSLRKVRGFWKDLPIMPGSRELFKFVSKYPHETLTAYPKRMPEAQDGKTKFMRTKFKFKGKMNLVMRADKQKYAKNKEGKPNILIDDYIKNIRQFESAGGVGIHHTNASKTINTLKKLGFK